MAGRVPIQLSPQQSLLLAVIGGLVVVGLLGGLILEIAVGSGISAVLRLFGVRAPAKSRARMAIDELEARVRTPRDPGPPPH